MTSKPQSRKSPPRKPGTPIPGSDDQSGGERIAKRMARAGLCSRRDAERWIADGRVSVNGKVLKTPACVVTSKDRIEVDGAAMPMRERTRLWLYHKPSGRVTTDKDPEGRPTVFQNLPDELPRVMSVGRLDINTEGLLLLTNDGGLARVLELPTTGWLRRYRVRAHGAVTQEQLDGLAGGVAIDGVLYGAIEATLERQQGTNVWLTFAMREGKNREVRNVLASLGLTVNRLIRISYGPFQLGDLAVSGVREVRGRTLRDQLGTRLLADSGAEFDLPIPESAPEKPAPSEKQKVKPRSDRSKAKIMNPLERLDTKPQRPVRKPTDKTKSNAGSKRSPKDRTPTGKRSKPGNADRRR